MFEYSKQVQKGFKYRYQFMIQGETVIDFTSEFSESKTGRLTNHIFTGNPQLATMLSKQQSYVHPAMRNAAEKEALVGMHYQSGLALAVEEKIRRIKELIESLNESRKLFD